MNDDLPIYTIYRQGDGEGVLVMKFMLDKQTGAVWVWKSLEAARAELARQGLVRIDRSPEDIPAIVESWL
jgi:hypothetical protein